MRIHDLIVSTCSLFPISLLITTGALSLFLLTTGCDDSRPVAKDPDHPLRGKTIAILVDNGFEQAELLEPRKALEDAGATTVIISEKSGTVKAWNKSNWGVSIPVDMTLDQAKPENFDALLLPGGVMNPDQLRINKDAVAFARTFVIAGKPIAAICHGPWLLIEAGGVSGKRMTSWPSLRSDLTNAGAIWVDNVVVEDGNLVTSRKPDDIPEFNQQMVLLFAKSPTV